MTPLFPLPDVVFFPKTLLPLHVYEPRYRALASEALEQDRVICTALLKPGWESDYDGSPEVYPVGCLGKIVQHQKLPDGRYNITLDGIAKVSIESSVRLEPYRLVRVKPMEDDATWARSQGAMEEAAELMQKAHKLNGALQALGATTAAALAQRLEDLGRAGHVRGAVEVAVTLGREVDRLLSYATALPQECTEPTQTNPPGR